MKHIVETGMISVIVPVYNAQRVLERCISSIVNQTYRNLQIILVNDGSTDNSGKICQKYKADSRIVVINKKNGGASSARNEGLKAATGEFLMFVDADDYIEAKMIELLAKAQKKQNAEVVFCGYCKHIKGKKIVVDLWEDPGFELLKNSSGLGRLYQKMLLNSPCVKLVKRSLIRNGFHEGISIGEDILFNLDYMKQVRTAACINYIGYHYVINTKGGLHLGINNEDVAVYKEIHRKTRAFFSIAGHQSLLDEADQRLLVNCYGFLEAVFRNEKSSEKRRQGIRLITMDQEILDVMKRIPKADGRRLELVKQLLRKKKQRAVYVYFSVNHYGKKLLR